MSSHLHELPTLTLGLASISIDALLLTQLQAILVDRPEALSAEQWAEVRRRLAELDERARPHLLGERLVFLDEMQRLYSNEGYLARDGLLIRIYPGEPDEPPPGLADRLNVTLVLPLVNVLFPRRQAIEQDFDRVMDAVEQYASLPMWEQFAVRHEMEAAFQRWHGGTRLIIAPFVFDPSYAVGSHAQIIARRDAVQVAIALERYRRERGDYPAALAELVPAYLAREPVDHSTGRPLLYAIREGRPVLYGRGLDADDDGGVMTEEAEARWPQVPEAEDWVVHPATE